jgi:hypothetical protein
VPEVGDSFSLEGYKFTVMEMDGFRVTRIKVEKLPPEEPEKAPEEEKTGEDGTGENPTGEKTEDAKQ